MAYEPLHHKYRPQTFADLVGQTAIATTLSNAIEQERIAPAYLFTGPRGTGKTSSARILAKSLNCLAGDRPTATPCGVCETCQSITKGSALDVIEIDAASNTGVDNIREIIERAQFAPVQCRYKVYVIDECLTAESQILTQKGWLAIGDPSIKDQQVLSFNEVNEEWQYKKVLRWLDQGKKQTLEIKTDNCTLRCTANHLIRTEQGWIKAQDITLGMKILSAQPENGVLTYENLPFLQWTTNLESVKSITISNVENVYDIEVEDNHNFVANGLLVHNCHMLSTAAFNALLKTLEEPPEQVVFVLATTDPQRVLPTIISRCQRFDYRRIPLPAMVDHLGYIAVQEAINIDQAALTLVAQIANGGLRDAESLLDQLSLLPDLITPDKVWDLVGAVPEGDLLALLRAIASDNSEVVLVTCRQILDRGREPLTVLQNLASFYLNLLIAQQAPQRQDLVAVTEATWQELRAIAPEWNTSTILQGQQKLKESEVQLRHTTQPRLWLEVTLLGLLPSALVPSESVAVQVKTVTLAPPQTPAPSQPAVPANKQVISTPPPSPTPKTTVNPSPAKVAVDSPPEPKPTPTVNHDPATVWPAVIERLSNLSRSLISNHCRLASLTNHTAQVVVSGVGLLGTAQSKKKEVETAFAAVVGHPIQVSFITENQGNVANSPTLATKTEEKVAPPPPTSVTPVTRAEQQSPPKTTVVEPKVAQNHPVPTRETNSRPVQVSSTPRATSTPRSQPKAPPALEEAVAPTLEESQSRQLIEQFAKNFGGQIVVSEVGPQASGDESADTKPLVKNRPVIDPEDEDLDF